MPTRPISSAFTRGRASRHATLVQCPGSKTHKSYLICFQWSLFFLCRTNGPLDFPSQMPTRPSSSAFSGRYFSLAACAHVPMRFPGQIPQVLSHLLLVVVIFHLLHPLCQLEFPGQIPTSISMKHMRWEFFMGYTCYSPNTCVL